jgi:hypothetical protein
MDAHETSLSKLSEHDWNVLRSHWSRFSGYAFCPKLGRKWIAEGFGIRSPLFKTKGEAERYVSNLILAESPWRAYQRQTEGV